MDWLTFHQQRKAIQNYNLTLNNKSRMIIIFSSLNHRLLKMTVSQRAERLVSMRFEKIMILFFGLFLGFLFYPLLITPFPKVPLTRELKLLGIEDVRCLMMLMHFVPQVSQYSAQVANLFEPLLLRDPRPRPRILCFVLTSPGGLFHIIFAFLHFSSFK